MDLNKAMVIGRLTQDPDARTTPNGINVTSFSVATNYVYKNQAGEKVEQVEYHNIVLWRRLGEIAAQYLKRGSRVFIEGRLATRSWDGNDGTKKYKTEIIADNLIMLDSRPSGGSPTAVPAADIEPVTSSSEPAPATPAATKGDDEIKVEDIPF